jgi:hypothetical protein
MEFKNCSAAGFHKGGREKFEDFCFETLNLSTASGKCPNDLKVA